jgi:hypothetical protein
MVKRSRVIGRDNWKQLPPCFGDPLCLRHQGFCSWRCSSPKQVTSVHQLMWLAVRAYHTVLIPEKPASLKLKQELIPQDSPSWQTEWISYTKHCPQIMQYKGHSQQQALSTIRGPLAHSPHAHIILFKTILILLPNLYLVQSGYFQLNSAISMFMCLAHYK